MNGVVRTATVVLLAFALSGCTAVAPGPGQTGGAAGVTAALSAEAVSDVGNARPAVSYDGLMVRRRVVVAIHPNDGADLVALRRELNRAAAREHLFLADVSPDVLDAVVLEHLVPEVIVALPDGATLSDAGRLIDPAGYPGGAFPGASHFHVDSVLVHELRFSIRSKDPAGLADAIDREGILSDALGNYESTARTGRLDLEYTGPLLGDALVESVRAAIARAAHAHPGAVTVGPRSESGTGVDMAAEPAPAAPGEDVPAGDGHEHG
ncbi:hypothetical protein RCH16_002658 [Cryobacterium sp. MP_M5]|uniref:hypothetical protein n=1 Tax=unclassified Cryobacterium TaxID=2649013 RepID=UPI0018CBDF80|nr:MULTISPECIES: hypothetical protein [unclassified Cryobacterium]MBG6059383.1 hypothetical protein [Cryobacterium sp. MP_M3]MEC5177638.1 hypothetical protein [Cryobacterium sp. MP_M5]